MAQSVLFEKLSSPTFDAPVDIQVDWLELAALLSPYNSIPILSLADQQDMEWDQEPTDIADADAVLEEIILKVIEEIERRNHDLEGCYPYNVSHDGTTLTLNPEMTAGQAIYIFSLVMAHATDSEVIPKQLAPNGAQLRSARDLFQICATLAAAGHCNGPSYSVGWPRTDGSKFLAKLHEVWAHFGDGKPRLTPLEGTPTQVKDEGIDVIAWTPERDKQPGAIFLVGQVASGNDWKNKSIRPNVALFMNEWFDVQPVAVPTPAIFIPFNVSSHHMRRTSSTHGYVVHRGRLARLAEKATSLALAGIAPIERLGEIQKIQQWIDHHLSSLNRGA